MYVRLELNDDKELREAVKNALYGQIKSLTREALKEILDEVLEGIVSENSRHSNIVLERGLIRVLSKHLPSDRTLREESEKVMRQEIRKLVREVINEAMIEKLSNIGVGELLKGV